MNVQHTDGRFFIEIEVQTDARGVKQLQAELLYKVQGNIMDLYHTFTPEPLRGRGLAEQLAKAAFEYAKQHGLKIKPTCSYVRGAFLKKHAEWNELIVE